MTGYSPRVVRWAGAVAAVLPLLVLVFVLGVLLIEATGAIKSMGRISSPAPRGIRAIPTATPSVSHGVAHPLGADYGALPLIVGTLASSAIALIVAVPVSIGAAFAIVQRLPRRLASAVGMVLEVLAGIPSVVVGLWGAMTFGPFIAHRVAPMIARNAPNVPVLDYFRGNTGNGEGMLVSGLVLAVMIIPDHRQHHPRPDPAGAIAAPRGRDRAGDVRLGVPYAGSPCRGCPAASSAPWCWGSDVRWARRWPSPWCRGRSSGAMPTNIYSTMTTIAATVVSQLDSALTDSTNFAVKTLAEVSLVLLLITLLTNVAARAVGAPGVGDRPAGGPRC